MAFNTGYPMNYGQMGYYNPIQAAQNTVQQAQQQLSAMQPTNNSSPIWVQGEAGAKSYLVAPNSSVLLMDSEGAYFYMKSADPSGMPNTKKYAYQEVEMGGQIPKQNNTIDLSAYVKKDELESLLSSYLTRKIDERKKTEVSINE